MKGSIVRVPLSGEKYRDENPGRSGIRFYTEHMRNVILPIILLIIFAAVLGVVACGSAKVSIEVDGFDVSEDEWKSITHELSARLRFEHDCDGPYEFVLIKKQHQFPSEIGVVACDKKWIFSRTIRGMKPGDWKARLTSSPSSSRWMVPETLDSDTAKDDNADTEDMDTDTASDNAPDDKPGDDISKNDSETDASSDAQPDGATDTDTDGPGEDSENS